ncbi:hypothetical protein O181_050309 [Austropuccinia psidii MF-1]|uniref:Uncharacterized protein n=1 Tax=Austropuccinia psidii MF-1 TaxID=1389203 RepID=A0A9Q3HPK2_9BASI|nr:hypothetical protein [Austropuccinia psidii MF-1]
MFEKCLNPRLTYDTPKKDLVDIQPKARSLKIIIYKERHHQNRFMHYSVNYARERWDKSHKPPGFKMGNLVLLSKSNFKNITEPNKLKASYEGPFMINSLHGPNAVQLYVTGELMKKHQPSL